jgi:hypothetical protein
MAYFDGIATPVIKGFLGLCLVSGLLTLPAHGQAAAEAAATTSVSGGIAAASPKANVMPNALPSSLPPGSAHLPSSAARRSPEKIRRELEAKAGKNAGKLLIRSLSGEAQVWIDGEPVGKTPLLLIIAPGKYEIELRGMRDERAKTQVALLPKETQELSIQLELRYPTRVTWQ